MHRTGADSGQAYLTVQIDGERYSVWDTKYFDQLQVGSEIEYDFRQSGNFKNITEVSSLDGQPPSSYQPNNRSRNMTRLSCLKSASRIVAPVHLDVDAKRELVVDTARYFERYVQEDDVGTLPQQDKGERNAGNSQ